MLDAGCGVLGPLTECVSGRPRRPESAGGTGRWVGEAPFQLSFIVARGVGCWSFEGPAAGSRVAPRHPLEVNAGIGLNGQAHIKVHPPAVVGLATPAVGKPNRRRYVQRCEGRGSLAPAGAKKACKRTTDLVPVRVGVCSTPASDTCAGT